MKRGRGVDLGHRTWPVDVESLLQITSDTIYVDVSSSCVAGPERPPPTRVEAFLFAPPLLVKPSFPAGRSCVAPEIGYQFSVGMLRPRSRPDCHHQARYHCYS